MQNIENHLLTVQDIVNASTQGNLGGLHRFLLYNLSVLSIASGL